jgi:endonuclease/exonuclease/phosphatase (EEP) superfamily protein YafD
MRDVIREVTKEKAHVISFYEVGRKWGETLHRKLRAKYPYSIIHHRGGDGYGIAFFSSLPFTGRVLYLGKELPPIITTKVTFSGRLVEVIALHAPNPITPYGFRRQSEQFTSLVKLQTTAPQVIMGDFNATPWGSAYMKVLENLKLVDSRRELGFLSNTWAPLFCFVPLLPIDHIFGNKEAQIVYLKTFAITGSDHEGILGEVRIANTIAGEPNI